MASVRLGPNGEIEVLVPPTPEEILEAEAALQRVIKALAELAVERDWAEQKRLRDDPAAMS
jgi:hypothetical protein